MMIDGIGVERILTCFFFGVDKKPPPLSKEDREAALPPAVREEIQRLHRERQDLLSSGVYTSQDRLITMLDDRIEALLSSSETDQENQIPNRTSIVS